MKAPRPRGWKMGAFLNSVDDPCGSSCRRQGGWRTRRAREADYRTRTDDPLLTMEVCPRKRSPSQVTFGHQSPGKLPVSRESSRLHAPEPDQLFRSDVSEMCLTGCRGAEVSSSGSGLDSDPDWPGVALMKKARTCG